MAETAMAIDLEDANDGIRVLTLAGTDRSGYLDTPALHELTERLQGLATDAGLRVLLIRGNEGMFCRGRKGAQGLTKASAVAEDLNAILQVNAAMDALAVPVLCALEGEAFGFGFGLTAQSDYAVAAEGTLLSLPEMSHGLPPLIVLSYLFRFVPYKRAIELAVSSRQIGPQEAMAAGIVTEIVPKGEAVARALAVARQLAGFDAGSLAALRKFARYAAGAHSAHLAEHAVSIMSVLLSERAQASAHKQ